MWNNLHDALYVQRLDFARANNMWYELGTRSATYYAPDRWFMYNSAEGNQNELWDSRWEDGKLWSAFLKHDMTDWLNDLVESIRK